MIILKILHADEWAAFDAAGETRGAPIDLVDGFIHFSTPDQVVETATRHFSGAGDLWLVAVEADTLGGALKWEVSRGGAKFPHLHDVLRRDQVLWAKPWSAKDGAP